MKKTQEEIKKEIQRLTDAYAEILQAIHETNHDGVCKALSETIYPLNRAIKDLESWLEL